MSELTDLRAKYEMALAALAVADQRTANEHAERNHYAGEATRLAGAEARASAAEALLTAITRTDDPLSPMSQLAAVSAYRDELQLALNSMTTERDVALARVAELEKRVAELEKANEEVVTELDVALERLELLADLLDEKQSQELLEKFGADLPDDLDTALEQIKFVEALLGPERMKELEADEG